MIDIGERNWAWQATPEMKVALVAEWLDPWRGGAETSTLQFLHGLMDRGVEVQVFTRSRPSPTPFMHVHTVSGASMSRLRRSVTFAHRVDRILRTLDFDVVHAISPCFHCDIYQPRGGTVAESIGRNVALLKSPAVRTIKRYANRLNLKQRYMLALERKLLRPATGPIVVAISNYVVDQLKKHYHWPDSKIRLVFNGIDPARVITPRSRDARVVRHEFGIGDQEFLVLLVAHNFRLKGVQRWMEALAVLRHRGITDIRSLVVGRGDSPRWHRLSKKMGIDDALSFTGPVDRVGDLFHAADAMVHPTYYDPCSRVVLEALAVGLPCITTKWDGAAEMIEQGVSGFVLDDPTDVTALADRVADLRNGRIRRRNPSESNILGRISMDRHTEAMLGVYEEVRSGSGVNR